MFTLSQIDIIHTRLGKKSSLPEYLRALRAIGVIHYDSYLADGHSEYFGDSGIALTSPPVHEQLVVANIANAEAMHHHLQQHNAGKTTYLAMSHGLADCGVEKWRFDTVKMTITYYSKEGDALLTENIR